MKSWLACFTFTDEDGVKRDGDSIITTALNMNKECLKEGRRQIELSLGFTEHKPHVVFKSLTKLEE